MITREGILHQQVCDYLKRRYPDVIFRTDFAAGIKMTIGQASRHKRLQHSRAFPDLTIFEPKGGYCGLFIELKATDIFLRDGSMTKNKHVQEQAKLLDRLRFKNYYAEFAVGFDQAKKIIDAYLSQP